MLCKIIPERCIACGLCQIYAPLFFDYTDEGIVVLKHKELATTSVVAEKYEPSVLTAYKKCPVHSINIVKE